MQAITSLPNVSNLERSRKIPQGLMVVEHASASLARAQRRRLCGRLSAKAMRIA